MPDARALHGHAGRPYGGASRHQRPCGETNRQGIYGIWMDMGVPCSQIIGDLKNHQHIVTRSFLDILSRECHGLGDPEVGVR